MPVVSKFEPTSDRVETTSYYPSLNGSNIASRFDDLTIGYTKGYKSFDGPRVKPDKPFLHPTQASGNFIKSQYAFNELIYKEEPGTVNTLRTVSEVPLSLSEDNFPDTYGLIRKAMQRETVSLADNIGEWQESASLFKGAVKLMHEALQLRRGRIPPRWARLAKGLSHRKWTVEDVSAAWIAGSFAISPALGLLNDTVYQFSGSSGPNVITKRIARYKQNASNHTYHVNPGSSISSTFNSTVRCSRKVIVYYEIDVNAPSFAMGSPAEWVWAAIPFSFVIDWMVGVGSFLQTANLDTSLKNLVGVTVDVRRETAHGGRNFFTSPDGRFTAGSSKKGHRTEIAWSRTPFYDVPPPGLPSWQPASSGVLPTAIALLHQMRR